MIARCPSEKGRVKMFGKYHFSHFSGFFSSRLRRAMSSGSRLSMAFFFARSWLILSAPVFASPLLAFRFASFSFHTPRPAATARTSSGRRSRFSSPRISTFDNPCAASASTFAVSATAILRYLPPRPLRHLALMIFAAQFSHFTWWWIRQCCAVSFVPPCSMEMRTHDGAAMTE